MKQIREIEVYECDICERKAHSWNKCLLCGIDLCYDCIKSKAKQYNHSVNFSGSGDGIYCLPCDNKARKTDDPLHSAYLLIEGLRNEESGWCEDFKKRSKKAEATLQTLINKRKDSP